MLGRLDTNQAGHTDVELADFRTQFIALSDSVLSRRDAGYDLLLPIDFDHPSQAITG